MKTLVSLLAIGTAANLAVTWAANPEPEVLAASKLSVPSAAPAWMLGGSSTFEPVGVSVDGAVTSDPSAGTPLGACKLVVVVRNSCPFCQLAAEKASTSDFLTSGTTWVASGMAEADSFRISHPGLAVVKQASAVADLQVQGVPAAFLVRGDLIVASWGFRGTESPSDIAKHGCGASATTNLE